MRFCFDCWNCWKPGSLSKIDQIQKVIIFSWSLSCLSKALGRQVLGDFGEISSAAVHLQMSYQKLILSNSKRVQLAAMHRSQPLLFANPLCFEKHDHHRHMYWLSSLSLSSQSLSALSSLSWKSSSSMWSSLSSTSWLSWSCVHQTLRYVSIMLLPWVVLGPLRFRFLLEKAPVTYGIIAWYAHGGWLVLVVHLWNPPRIGCWLLVVVLLLYITISIHQVRPVAQPHRQPTHAQMLPQAMISVAGLDFAVAWCNLRPPAALLKWKSSALAKFSQP